VKWFYLHTSVRDVMYKVKEIFSGNIYFSVFNFMNFNTLLCKFWIK